MLLNEAHITSEEAVQYLCGELALTSLGHKAILLAELVVLLALTQSLASHLEGVPPLATPRQEKSVLGAGQHSLGGVQRAIVKARIVCHHIADAILANHIAQDMANSGQAAQGALSAFDFVPILGDFLSEVGTCHQVFVKEHISHHIGVGLIGVALTIHNRKADVIAKGVVNGVGGFGVDYKVFGVHKWISFLCLVSLDYILIIHYGLPFVKCFLKVF